MTELTEPVCWMDTILTPAGDGYVALEEANEEIAIRCRRIAELEQQMRDCSRLVDQALVQLEGLQEGAE